jgi:hypothetical protein
MKASGRKLRVDNWVADLKDPVGCMQFWLQNCFCLVNFHVT